MVDPSAYAAALEEWLRSGPPSLAPTTWPGISTDRQMSTMRDLMAELFARGWSRYGWPEEVGGLGGTMVHRALLWEALARYGVRSMAAFEHLEVLGPTLVAMGPPDFVADAFPAFLDGTQTWAQGFSEPDAGSDLATLRTRAAPADGGYLLSGRKIWTSYAAYARWILVLARTGTPESRHRGITAVIVDAQSDGVEVRRISQANGHEELAEVTFDSVFVPANRIIGHPEGGWAVAMHILGHERGTFAWFRHGFLLQALAGRAVAAPGDADGLLGDAILDLAGVRALSAAAVRDAAAGEVLGPRACFTKLALCAAEQGLQDWMLAVDPDLAADPFDQTELEARSRYLFSRIVTVYGGSQQMQLETVAKQILRLPS